MSNTLGMPPVGAVIQIPVLQPEKGFDGTNKVYNPIGTHDNYGHDIGIGENGKILVTGGDLGVSNQEENLMQAVLMRLSTAVGTRIRNLAYGIRANIGDGLSSIKRGVATTIEATLLTDPRISSIDNLSFSGKGDHLDVKITFTDINQSQHQVQGVF